MEKWIAVVAVALPLVMASTDGAASAGTLKSCEGVSTAQGFKYIGTYCVDFACQYVTRRMFDSYCPFQLPN